MLRIFWNNSIKQKQNPSWVHPNFLLFYQLHQKSNTGFMTFHFNHSQKSSKLILTFSDKAQIWWSCWCQHIEQDFLSNSHLFRTTLMFCLFRENCENHLLANWNNWRCKFSNFICRIELNNYLKICLVFICTTHIEIYFKHENGWPQPILRLIFLKVNPVSSIYNV